MSTTMVDMKLRLTHELKSLVSQNADANGRTMNGEIIRCIEEVYGLRVASSDRITALEGRVAELEAKQK